MRLVIDIPKHVYEHAKEQSEDGYDEWDAMRAIANGKLLPKGHKRLIDAEELSYNAETCIETTDTFIDLINEAPTIIEAEGE